MAEHNSPSAPLTVNNYKAVVERLISPHRQLIVRAQQNFKHKVNQYKQSRAQGNVVYQKSVSPSAIVPSHISSKDFVDRQDEDYDATKRLIKLNQSEAKSKKYDLCEWKSQNITSFPDYQHLANYYQQIFNKKKSKSKNKKNYYDFRIDEKNMLVNIFNQIRSEPGCIQFKNVIQFFGKCKLFYLYYNIKPFKLIDILKDSARTFQDKLTLQQFLNVFFYDRPNITSYDDLDNIYVRKRCVLGQQNWKELRQIFNTLDTFGNETVNLQPFLFKIKNNYGNRQLVNEPAIEYPEIKRTIPLKKIIFVLQNRCDCSQKIRWEEIQQIISNFKYISEPTIDTIYHKLIERGEITKCSNYFMISQQLIDEIKDIFDRSPKYCEYFVKTNFICHELVESNRIKSLMKDGIVRILQKGTSTYFVKFEEQIRMIATYAKDYIDKDELLQYFSIKGPINTTEEASFDDQAESSDEEDNERLKKLARMKSMEMLRGVSKKQTKRKGARYITSCEEFNLTTNNKESTMQRKTREWVEGKRLQDQLQYSKKFKANPIPVELNPQKYKDYISKLEEINELRRKQFNRKKRQQIKVYQYLKSNTYLFNKKFRQDEQKLPKEQYKFVSKSIPWFVTEVYMLDKINQKKKLRQKNLYSESKVKIIRQWKKLPDVMMMEFDQISQTHEENFQEEPVVSAEKIINRVEIKTKAIEVPNFKQLHQQFQQELDKKKKEFTPTVPVQFKFSSPKPKKQHLQTVKENISSTSSPNFNALNRHKASIQTAIVKPQIQIPTTAKYIDMVNFNHQKLQKKRIQKIKKQQQEKQRKTKQVNFAKFMRKKLKNSFDNSQSLQNLSKSKLSHHRYEEKLLKKQNEEEMCKIYEKVMARPFLFQSNSPKFAQTKKNDPQQPKYVPMKKKNRVNWKKTKQKEEKQVHHSPLKDLEAEMDNQSQTNKIKQNHFEFQQQNQDKMNYLNQSF